MMAVRAAAASRSVAGALLLLLCAAAASAQTPLPTPAKGRFLVAEEELRDPNFFHTVVLMLDYNEKGAMGVIVNRPTSVELRDLLPKVEGLELRSDKVYLGGPVEPNGLLLVVRQSEEPPGFLHVAQDLYTGANLESLAALVAEGLDPNQVRAYAGYAGWGPGQLDLELEQGSWVVIKAQPAQVFDPSPESLWRKLIDGTKVLFAGLGGTALLH